VFRLHPRRGGDGGGNGEIANSYKPQAESGERRAVSGEQRAKSKEQRTRSKELKSVNKEYKMKPFKQLQVWEKAHQLVLSIYQKTSHFPQEEIYGLVSQIRRASVSIPSNIAEGCGREGDAEFGRFLQMAMGSVNEVEYQIILAHDLKMFNDSDFFELNSQLEVVRRMLIALIKKVKTDKLK
jgi:four helix bundle protein